MPSDCGSWQPLRPRAELCRVGNTNVDIAVKLYHLDWQIYPEFFSGEFAVSHKNERNSHKKMRRKYVISTFQFSSQRFVQFFRDPAFPVSLFQLLQLFQLSCFVYPGFLTSFVHRDNPLYVSRSAFFCSLIRRANLSMIE